MAAYEDGYLQALFDTKAAVQEMVVGPEASPEGKVELLGIVSFLAEQIRARLTDYNDDKADSPANENAALKD